MQTRIPPYRIGVWCLSQIKLKLELKLNFAISEISKQNKFKLSLVNLVLSFHAEVSFNADKMHTEKILVGAYTTIWKIFNERLGIYQNMLLRKMMEKNYITFEQRFDFL